MSDDNKSKGNRGAAFLRVLSRPFWSDPKSRYEPGRPCLWIPDSGTWDVTGDVKFYCENESGVKCHRDLVLDDSVIINLAVFGQWRTAESGELRSLHELAADHSLRSRLAWFILDSKIYGVTQLSGRLRKALEVQDSTPKPFAPGALARPVATDLHSLLLSVGLYAWVIINDWVDVGVFVDVDIRDSDINLTRPIGFLIFPVFSDSELTKVLAHSFLRAMHYLRLNEWVGNWAYAKLADSMIAQRFRYPEWLGKRAEAHRLLRINQRLILAYDEIQKLQALLRTKKYTEDVCGD